MDLWADVLTIAGPGNLTYDPSARFILFAPSDAAVKAFLVSMGLNMTGLAARPRLAKDLIAAHLVLAVAPNVHKHVAEGQFGTVPTLAHQGQAALRVSKQAGGVVITDSQGNKANVLKLVQLQPSQSAIVLDKVLMAGTYYTNFASLCNALASLISDVCSALLRSGVLYSLSNSDYQNTVFLPGNLALAKAGVTQAQLLQAGSAEDPKLRSLMRYWVVPGVHTIPEGFRNYSSYSTLLPGTQLTILYETVEDGLLQAYVLPASGGRVPVVVPNIFVGQRIQGQRRTDDGTWNISGNLHSVQSHA
eukprot:gene6645-6870_t